MDNHIEGEIVNTSPTPRKQVKTLSFPEAIAAVIDGKKVTKLEWNDASIYGFLGIDGYLKINLPAKLDNWLLRDGDLNGTDYIIVEEVN
jgi:hypothetical protein